MAEFADDMVVLAIAAGVASSKLLISTAVQLPPSGECVSFVETGGTGPERTHNDTYSDPSWLQPTLQIVVHSKKYTDAMRVARQIRTAVLVKDQVVNGTRYRKTEVLQEPVDMGQDANARAQVGFNLRAVKRRPAS